MRRLCLRLVLYVCLSLGWIAPTPITALAPWYRSDSALEEARETPLSKSGAPTQILVSPLLNREVLTRIKAPWRSSAANIFCEALAYHNNEGIGREFLDNLSRFLFDSGTSMADCTEWTYDSAIQATLQVSPIQSASQKSLFQLFLLMRASSPTCELHQSLADAVADPSVVNMDAFSIAYPSRTIVVDSTLYESKVQNCLGRNWSRKEDYELSSVLLDSDIVIQGRSVYKNRNSSMIGCPLIIMYANLGCRSFANLYQTLVESNVRFAVRHFQRNSSVSVSSIPLQGYGVSLDIRNVEYKVFDDRTDEEKSHDDQFIDLFPHLSNNQTLQVAQTFLAGVNFSAIAFDLDEKARRKLQSQLWQSHENQQLLSQIVPPVWQRRQLPLQATYVITNSTDPLVTLQEVSQNLPSLASTLVHVKIPEILVNQTSGLQRLAGHIYVNGRPISLGYTTFNVFELLNLFQQEQRHSRELQSKLGPYLDRAQLEAVHKAWACGKSFVLDAKQPRESHDPSMNEEDALDDTDDEIANSFYRINVGHGWKQAVIYLNDIEKDAMYSRWPTSLNQMLMMMQFGRPPSVRRNLFTFLCVLDPIEKTNPSAGLDLSLRISNAQYPSRTGLVIVNETQVEECAKWVADNSVADGLACPIGQVLHGNPSRSNLKNIVGNAQAMHTLFAYFAEKHGNEGNGAMLAYTEYFLEHLNDVKKANDGKVSMYDLVVIHGSLMHQMNIASVDSGKSEAFEALVEGTDDTSEFSYGKALRFAVDKRLVHDVCFINGRPIPSTDGQTAAEIFRSEQGTIFNMIISGEITDRSPKSVYGKLLTGDLVFKFYHPLLDGDSSKEDMYIEPIHLLRGESLMKPGVTSELQDHISSRFVLEAVIDYSTREGVLLVESIMDVMRAFSSDDARVAYRFLPGSSAAAESSLCPILLLASMLEMESLKSLIAFFATRTDLAVEAVLDTNPNASKRIIESILNSSARMKCLSLSGSMMNTSNNYITVNGRKLSIDDVTKFKFDRAAVEVLIGLESKRSRVVGQLLNCGSVTMDGVSRTATFLAREEALADNDYTSKRSCPYSRSLSSPEKIRFAWNHGGLDLQPHIVAIVDPATLAAQRMSPLLRIIRNKLQFPLTVILAPEELIDGDSKAPITSYYRFVANMDASSEGLNPQASFSYLPLNHVLTLKVDVPEPWNVQQSIGTQDMDNLRCAAKSGGCGDSGSEDPLYQQQHLTQAEYVLKSLLLFGRCVESSGRPPNGLQLILSRDITVTTGAQSFDDDEELEIGIDGSTIDGSRVKINALNSSYDDPYSDTLVMLNMGYWQLQAAPGVWSLQIATNSRGANIFDLVEGENRGNSLILDVQHLVDTKFKRIVMKDFVNQGEILVVKRREGLEQASLFPDDTEVLNASKGEIERIEDGTINVFSLATGHLYERFLKIMMLSVTKRTSAKVKFWLFENFLSPSFKASAQFMAKQIGCEVEFVTYKWPEWLRGQTEKQRIIWGYKILFLDVLFPLNVKKFIYVDADQVVRGDLKELWDLDLQGAPYGYTPFCTSRETTLGYQFWREGFWKNHLRDLPYHISALYVVDLDRFRKDHVGDTLRSVYQQLSVDPNSLSNLDQDLPNYAQHQVRIFSLPQDWLWCESWCSDETKASAKTIDLCNNPLHKEPKVSMAKRIISGPLFNESWVELDLEVERHDQELLSSLNRT